MIYNHFSIGDFWVHVKEHLVSFGFQGLPAGVHFTVGFDPRSSDINLHLTKNGPDPANKPKITIVKIDKELLGSTVEGLALMLFHKYWQELDIEKLKKKTRGKLFYLSHSKLQESEYGEKLKVDLKDLVQRMSKLRKKTRIKINPEIGDEIGSLVEEESNLFSIQKLLTDLPVDYVSEAEAGEILASNKLYHVIRIGNKWFSKEGNFDLFDLLSTITDNVTARKLISKTKRAVISIQKATYFLDTEELNKPMRLEAKSRIS